VKHVDTALTTLRIFNNPFCRHFSPVGPKPGIKNEVRDGQDLSCPGDLSNSSRNKPERRTKPMKRMRRFAEGVADHLIAPGKIEAESLEVPQISKPMVKRVINQKMPASCDRASLFRPVRNLATNQTEACLNAELL